MRTFIIAWFAISFSFVFFITAAGAEITLEEIDRIRSPEGNFIFTVTTASADEKPIKLEVRVKDSTSSLVRYIEPKGRSFLFIDQNMWVYIAGSRRELRISPRQKLLGGAASADIARLAYAVDYVIEAIEDTGDGRRLLTLKRQSKTAAYARIKLTIAGGDGRPIEAVFYASSGNHAIKTAYFEEYRSVLGRERPTRFRIVDHLDGNKETILTYSDFRLEETPDNWFNPAYLKRLK
jgi:outer membrane lipoprotein-sorting protein